MLTIEQQFKVIADDIKDIADHAIKRREVIKILKRQAKPVVRKLSNAAPTADKVVTYGRNKSIKFDVGNLQRSMRVFSGKNKDYPTVFVGAKVPKRDATGSGYYSHFVQYGTKGRPNNIKRKNNFVLKTQNKVHSETVTKLTPELEGYITRKFKKKGYKVI